MQYRAPRHPTKSPITATIRGYKIECTLTDINEWGGCMTGIGGLVVDDEVVIACAHGRVEGRIKWIKDCECGVQFTPRIGEELVMALRNFGDPNKAHKRLREMQR